MSPATTRESDDDVWVTLVRGVRVNLAWMTRYTPTLLRAWQDASSDPTRTTIAGAILQLATDPHGDTPATEPLQQRASQGWAVIAARLDQRLITGPDWPPLAAALARADAAGYDVRGMLPHLLAAAPLPTRHSARELHWRLLADCPGALDPPPPAAVSHRHPPTSTTSPATPSADTARPHSGRAGTTPRPDG